MRCKRILSIVIIVLLCLSDFSSVSCGASNPFGDYEGINRHASLYMEQHVFGFGIKMNYVYCEESGESYFDAVVYNNLESDRGEEPYEIIFFDADMKEIARISGRIAAMQMGKKRYIVGMTEADLCEAYYWKMIFPTDTPNLDAGSEAAEELIHINQCPAAYPPRAIDSMWITLDTLYVRNGQTLFLATAWNLSKQYRADTLFDIVFYDATGQVISIIGGIIGGMNPGETVQINASATTDYSGACDWAIVMEGEEIPTFAPLETPQQTASPSTSILPEETAAPEIDLELLSKHSFYITKYDSGYSFTIEQMYRRDGAILFDGVLKRISEEAPSPYLINFTFFDENQVDVTCSEWTIDWFSEDEPGYCWSIHGAELPQNCITGVYDYRLLMTAYDELFPGTTSSPVSQPAVTVSPVSQPAVFLPPASPSASQAETTASPTLAPTPAVTPAVTPAPTPALTPALIQTPTPKPSAAPVLTPDPVPSVTPIPFVTSEPAAVGTALPSDGNPAVTQTNLPEQPMAVESSAPKQTSDEKTANKKLRVKKVTAVRTGQTRVTIRWRAAKGASGYEIWRCSKRKGLYQRLGRVNKRKTKYIDKTVKREKTYYYQIIPCAKKPDGYLIKKSKTISIFIDYYMTPIIQVHRGKSGSGEKYVEIRFQKYSGTYAEIYVKKGGKGKYIKLSFPQKKISQFHGKYKFKYSSNHMKLYFKARTYGMKHKRKRTSGFSRVKRIVL